MEFLRSLCAALLATCPISLQASADSLPCREDDGLSEVAAALLLSGAAPSSSELLSRARSLGFDGVALHAREGLDDEAARAWLARVRDEGDGILMCGEARSTERRLLLASVRGGWLRREGERLAIQLAPGFTAKSLVLERTTGELEERPLSARAVRDGVQVPDARALRRVQLVAESASGPRPVAEWVPPAADEPRAEPTSEASEPSARELDVLAALARFRREQGVAALRENRLLASSAHAHAARVCEGGRLAHRLEGEDPEDRLRREHIAARGVGEAIARAGSRDHAWRALMASPSHRLALVRRDFTDAGIGEARDRRGQLCLVVLLAAWPRRLP